CPCSWQSHRRAVVQTYGDLRWSTEHRLDAPALERTMRPYDGHLGWRGVTRVRSVLLFTRRRSHPIPTTARRCLIATSLPPPLADHCTWGATRKCWKEQST